MKRTKAGSIFAIEGEQLLWDAGNAAFIAIEHVLEVSNCRAVILQSENAAVTADVDFRRPGGVGADLEDLTVAQGHIAAAMGVKTLKRLRSHGSNASWSLVGGSVSASSSGHVANGKRQKGQWVCLAGRRLLERKGSEVNSWW